MMIAPGGQPTFVESAATLNVLGVGEGSVKESPMCRRCSSAMACESTTHPPARRRALASARLPFSSWLAGIGSGELLGGAITHARRSPTSRNPPRYMPSERTPGSDAKRAAEFIANGVVPNVFALPAAETHTSLTRFMSAEIGRAHV